MITITNDKLFQSDFGIASTKPKYIETIEDNKFCQFLTDTVEFSDDLKFNRIFELLISNKDIINIIFDKVLHGSKISDWLNDYNSVSTYNDNFELALCWHNDVFEWDNKIELSSYSTLSSFNETENEYDRYGSINFVSLSSLKDKRIFINKTFKLHDYEKDEVVFDYNKDMTLYDVILGILKEVCFHGTAENRDKQRQKLIEVSERIDRGEEKFYTSDEVREMLKEKFKLRED